MDSKRHCNYLDIEREKKRKTERINGGAHSSSQGNWWTVGILTVIYVVWSPREKLSFQKEI